MLGFCFFPLLVEVRSWSVRIYQGHEMYVPACALQCLLLFWNNSTIWFQVTEVVFTCLMLQALLTWNGQLICLTDRLSLCFQRALSLALCMLCVCFELVCAHGDSLDESKLLFWNKLDQCDLEPETCVVILAECCRWLLQQCVLQVEKNACGGFMLSGCSLPVLHLKLDVCRITCLWVTLGKMQSSVAAANPQRGCAGLPESAKSWLCLWGFEKFCICGVRWRTLICKICVRGKNYAH